MSPARPPNVSRYTYQLHARAAVLEGIVAGVVATTCDVVAKKSLAASQFQITLLTMAPSASQLLALYLARRFAEVEQRKVFLWAGILGRLTLIPMALVLSPWPFLSILIVGAAVQTVVIPAQNEIYQANYHAELRGRLYGRAQVFGGIATAITAYLAGWALDLDAYAYRWMYPIAGVAGFAACIVFGRIRLRRTRTKAREPKAEAARPAIWRLLLDDAPFRRFEIAMFVYGMGFMCMQPVFAAFFVDVVHMEFSEAAQAKGVVFSAVPALFLVFAGRMHDRVGLERLATRAYVVLAVFAVFMAVATTPAHVVAAFALFGLGMAGVGIAWSMGPIKYAPAGDAARYMGVHVALVGIRAILGHPLGTLVAHAFGSPRATFVLAALFFSGATLLMMRAERLSGIRPSPVAAR